MPGIIEVLALTIAMTGSPEDLTEELRAAEIAFARAAEERDLDRFESFLAPDAVFTAGGRELRGPDSIRTAWSGFFDPEGPSISWQPESVTVLDDGSLGMSSGPYRVVTRNQDGDEVTLTGTFFSVWRHTEAGWRIILDGGTAAVAQPPTERSP